MFIVHVFDGKHKMYYYLIEIEGYFRKTLQLKYINSKRLISSMIELVYVQNQ